MERAGWIDSATAGKSGRPKTSKPSIESSYLAPTDIKATDDGSRLVVLGSVGRRVIILDRATLKQNQTIPLPAAPSGLTVRGAAAYITTGEPAGRILEVDLNSGTLRRQLRAGHTPMAPVLSPDGRFLYVANRFDHNVGLIDLETGQMRTVRVIREPVALALSPDGRRLFVANHLPEVRPFLDDDNPFIGAEISVIETATARLSGNLELPNGSQGVRGIAISPDGRWVAATHVLSQYTRPTWDIAQGAMNRNALSLVDATTLERVATVPLDDPDRGAANPWSIAFASDGRQLLVSHAGTHELSVIDFPGLLERVADGKGAISFPEKDLATMTGIRQRVALPINGPRALTICDGTVYAAGYFSDELATVDLHEPEPSVRRIALEPQSSNPLARQGERYFNDATRCFQQWQSCASCHPDGRSDALYWDLLNDGVGNTKNTKSLLMSALTPPVMWRGVRPNVRAAIMGGIHHIQFATPGPGEAEAIEEYLRQMPVAPSPHLNAEVLEAPKTDEASCAKCHYPGVLRGTLSESARRGKAIFEGKTGCAQCHPHPLFTSRQQIDPGLGSGVKYDVPSLIEAWRTAPYLHSGDALTLRETITDFNFQHQRGVTRDLNESELDDLLEYLKSL